MSKALMFLNGDQPSIDSFNSEYFDQFQIIICTDGAYDYLINSPITPNVIIGDFDSIKSPTITKNFIHLTDQNTTDFEKGLQYLVDNNYKSVEVWGVESGENKYFELDHILGNLTSALKFKPKIKILLNASHQIFYFLDKQETIATRPGQLVSLFPFPTAKVISTKGLLFQLKQVNLGIHSMIGIRNKALGNQVDIEFDEGEILVILTK